MSSPSLPVEYISDTAFLTAYYRALESDRSDALFQDPYARLLAGTHGEEIAQIMPGGESVAQGCAVRTCVTDELIVRTIQEDGVDTVLNLGAGLDTRPYRLPLPTSLRWIEGDLPNILTYKQEKLANDQPICHLESLPFNITDPSARQALFQHVSTAAKRVLVIAEGLLIYMTAEQVSAIATDLHAQTPFRWWLIEIASPIALQQLQASLENQPVPSVVRLQFAPEEGTEFFQRYGWEIAEIRSYLEEAKRLNRGMITESLLAQLSTEQWEVLSKMSRFALLTRANV
ncbi:MAG TPA: SAM-dependent methyltransferase [Cyanobacteria bacterium UBA8543]|nr:SAM-dependent methyltransferase [Cyanobacteria bacterium UBA8543]